MKSSASRKTTEPAKTKTHEATMRMMLLIRRFEEKCAELYSAGKIRGFLHLYIGEEAVAVGIIQALRPEDRVIATYREHGHALARGIDPGGIMAEMFGKSNGVSRGRGGSMHLFDAKTNFYGGHAIVGAGLPFAVGLALADKMRNEKSVTVCFFGEGAAAEGEFHEALNLASLWKLPVLFVCENNLYAMGTSLAHTHAQQDISKRAGGYAMQSGSVDGMSVSDVQDAARKALEIVRTNQQPFLLEARTYRFRAHSMYDPELYRPKEEVEEWKKRCPIESYKAELLASGALSEKALEALELEVEAVVQEAVAFAEAGELEPVEDLLRDVYTEA